MLNKSTRSNSSRQAECYKERVLNRKTETPFNLQDPMPKVKFPVAVVLGFRETKTRVLNCIINLSSKYKLLYPRQETIAKITGVHITTVNRILRELHNEGFIAKKWNGCNKSCWYKVSRFFNDADVQESLRRKITFFFFTLKAVTLLSVISAGAIQCLNVSYFISSLPKYPNDNTYVKKEEYSQKENLKEKGTIFEPQNSPPPKIAIEKPARSSKEIETLIERYQKMVDMLYASAKYPDLSTQPLKVQIEELEIELKKAKEWECQNQ